MRSSQRTSALVAAGIAGTLLLFSRAWRFEFVNYDDPDYVTANVIVNDGDVYANFSQHVPYMESFNAGSGGDLTGVQPVYNFTIAFYSKHLTDIADLPDGGTVATVEFPVHGGNREREAK